MGARLAMRLLKTPLEDPGLGSHDRLTLSDRLFLDVEDPLNNMHIAGCFIFDAGLPLHEGLGVDIDEICAYLESRLYRIPRYRQRIEYTPLEGHPIWIDDENFNILYHVRHTRLPLPGDDRQLKRLCGRIVSQQLDRHKPLWEMWVVEGLEHDRVALITKVHHCMADGISGVDLLEALLQPFPDKDLRSAADVDSAGSATEPKRPAVARNRWRGAFESAFDAGSSLRIGGERSSVRRFDAACARLSRASPSCGLSTRTQPRRRRSTGGLGPHRRYDWLGLRSQ